MEELYIEDTKGRHEPFLRMAKTDGKGEGAGRSVRTRHKWEEAACMRSLIVLPDMENP